MRTEEGRVRQSEAGRRTHKANFEKRLVPAFKIKPLVRELVERYGSERAAATACDVSRNMIRCVLHGKACEDGESRDMVGKSTARRIILALHEKRREDSRDHATSERFRIASQERAIREERMMRSYY